jgi:hypothetical protein
LRRSCVVVHGEEEEPCWPPLVRAPNHQLDRGEIGLEERGVNGYPVPVRFSALQVILIRNRDLKIRNGAFTSGNLKSDRAVGTGVVAFGGEYEGEEPGNSRVWEEFTNELNRQRNGSFIDVGAQRRFNVGRKSNRVDYFLSWGPEFVAPQEDLFRTPEIGTTDPNAD